MIGIEVEGFAVAIDCSSGAAGVPYQAEQVICLGGHSALAEAGLADLGSLVQASGIGKAARGFKVGLDGGRWPVRSRKLQFAAR